MGTGTYQIPLEDLSALADVVCALDGSFRPGDRELVEKGHAAIRRVLGDDVPLLYSDDAECAACAV